MVDIFLGRKTLVVDDGLIFKAEIVLAGLVDLCCQFLIGTVLLQVASRGRSNDCLFLESVVVSVVVVFYRTEVESIGLPFGVKHRIPYLNLNVGVIHKLTVFLLLLFLLSRLCFLGLIRDFFPTLEKLLIIELLSQHLPCYS